MSYHILHITTRGSSLYVDRGFLVCKTPDEERNKISLEDVRAIIVCTHGVSFTNECIARLLEQDSIILHCNKKYQPIGWTMPLDRVIRSKAFENQIKQDKNFEYSLWKIILKKKFQNQLYVLEEMGVESNLKNLIEKPLPNEANISKQYWQKYFETLNEPMKREHRNAETFENIALNYGYAVVSSLVHRSILIHGLLPSLGIHHKERYRSTPLVYDLVEPLRGFIELFLYRYSIEEPENFEEQELKYWTKYLANCLRQCRIKNNKTTHKLMDAVDIYVNSITNAFIKFNAEDIWIPTLACQYLHIDNAKNRENEE